MVVLFMKLDVGKTVESLSFPTNLEREKALLSVASFIICYAVVLKGSMIIISCQRLLLFGDLSNRQFFFKQHCSTKNPNFFIVYGYVPNLLYAWN